MQKIWINFDIQTRINIHTIIEQSRMENVVS